MRSRLRRLPLVINLRKGEIVFLEILDRSRIEKSLSESFEADFLFRRRQKFSAEPDSRCQQLGMVIPAETEVPAAADGQSRFELG